MNIICGFFAFIWFVVGCFAAVCLWAALFGKKSGAEEESAPRGR